MSRSNSTPPVKSEHDSSDIQIDTIPPHFASQEGPPSSEPQEHHTAMQAYDPFRTRQPTLTDLYAA